MIESWAKHARAGTKARTAFYFLKGKCMTSGQPFADRTASSTERRLLRAARSAVVLMSAVFSCVTHAQRVSESYTPDYSWRRDSVFAVSDAGDASQALQYKDPDQPLEHRADNRLVIGTGAALVGMYGLTNWWKGGFSSNFRSKSEGWFGQETKYGGADKAGHAYFTYTSARMMTRGFEAVGNDRATSLRLGFRSALGLMVGVEVLDGFSKRYHFSIEDAIMDVAGAGLAYATETYPTLDHWMDFRLLYKPSQDSSFEPAGDYSGQTYLFVLKASGAEYLRNSSFLRYFEVALGYGSRGYSDTRPTDPHRNLYAGISLNLSELLSSTVFHGQRRDGLAHRLSNYFLEFVQVPGTVVLKSRTL